MCEVRGISEMIGYVLYVKLFKYDIFLSKFFLKQFYIKASATLLRFVSFDIECRTHDVH